MEEVRVNMKSINKKIKSIAKIKIHSLDDVLKIYLSTVLFALASLLAVGIILAIINGSPVNGGIEGIFLIIQKYLNLPVGWANYVLLAIGVSFLLAGSYRWTRTGILFFKILGYVMMVVAVYVFILLAALPFV